MDRAAQAQSDQAVPHVLSRLRGYEFINVAPEILTFMSGERGCHSDCIGRAGTPHNGVHLGQRYCAANILRRQCLRVMFRCGEATIYEIRRPQVTATPASHGKD